jgi:hypothetical protein
MATNTIEVIINAEDNASKVVEGFGGALSGVADIAKNAVGTALGILTAQALPALGNALGGFISGEIEAEKVTAELEAVIKSTGGKAGVTAEAINEMANSLSAMTPFEDDAIVKGQSML